MSSANLLKFAGLAIAAAVLAGCQVGPLYAQRTATGSSVAAALAQVDVEAPATRAEQVFRNELVFGLGDSAGGDYSLAYELRLAAVPIAVQEFEGTPTYYTLRASLPFTLTDASGAVVLAGTEAADASFDRSSQVFANVRAERDAEDRVAAQLARQLRSRLSAALATR